MSAQAVFDCDDLKNEIFSYCLPQYPVVTKKMIDYRLSESELGLGLRNKNYPVIAIHTLLCELKYEAWFIRMLDGSDDTVLRRRCLLFPSEMECVYDRVHNKLWWGDRHGKLWCREKGRAILEI